MRTRTKIILGIFLFFVILFGGAILVHAIWQAVDPEGRDKYLDELEAEKEAEKIRFSNTPEGWDAANKKLAEEQKAGYYDSTSQQSESDSNSQSTSSDFEVEYDPDLVFENEPKAINLVGNFKYNSNSKYILNDVLDLVLDEQFGDDLAEVLDNPSTEWYWIGWMYPKYSDPNIWEVTYKIKTYNFDFEPHFIVDLTTGKVSAANNDADSVLQILKKING